MEATSPLKAIRAKCMDCTCYQRDEIKYCPVETCALHPFRFGKNPFINRTMTEEQRLIAAQRLKEAREKKKENT